MNKITIEVSGKELAALWRFKTIRYQGGYYLDYTPPKGYNFDSGLERLMINAFKKLARKARKQK